MASLESQYKALKVNLQHQIDAQLSKLLIEYAYALLYSAMHYKGYDDVTGNLREGITVGVYKNGSLYHQCQDDGKSPTRLTLAKGERYDLPRYWDGRDNKGFYGEVGEGGQSGPQEGKKFVKSYSINSQWGVVMVAPVEYASHVEEAWGMNVLLESYLMAPGLLEHMLEGGNFVTQTNSLPEFELPF